MAHQGPFRSYINFNIGLYGCVRNSVTNVYGPTLLAYGEGVGFTHFQKNVLCNTSLEWPLIYRIGNIYCQFDLE